MGIVFMEYIFFRINEFMRNYNNCNYYLYFYLCRIDL